MLVHKNCDGEVLPSPDGRGYGFEGEDAEQFGAFVPAYVCRKCGVDILGDSQVEVQDDRVVEKSQRS